MGIDTKDNDRIVIYMVRVNLYMLMAIDILVSIRIVNIMDMVTLLVSRIV